jgi:hypothetical protein
MEFIVELPFDPHITSCSLVDHRSSLYFVHSENSKRPNTQYRCRSRSAPTRSISIPPTLSGLQRIPHIGEKLAADIID